jgi:hypothetical protein
MKAILHLIESSLARLLNKPNLTYLVITYQNSLLQNKLREMKAILHLIESSLPQP